MNIIFFGALITIVGGLMTAWGTYKLNKTSSEKIEKIKETGDTINKKSDQQLDEVKELKSTIDNLNKKTSKQQETIVKLSEQNYDLSLQLSKSTETLYGNLTGGDSFCELKIKPLDNGRAQMILLNNGEFPIYEVSIRILDLDLFDASKIKTIKDFDKDQILLNIGNIPKQTGIPLENLTSDFSKDYKAFNIFFIARNGHFTQTTRLYKINGKWKESIKIFNNSKEKAIKTKTDPGIPKELLSSK